MQAIDSVMPGLPSRRPFIPDPGPPPSPRGPSGLPMTPQVGQFVPRPKPVLRPVVAPSVAPSAPAIALPALPSFSQSTLRLRPREYPNIANIATAIAVFVVAASVLVAHQPFGQTAVVLYGITAIRKQWPSRFTFLAALGSLAITFVLLLAFGNHSPLPATFGAYTFLLLGVGVVAVAAELRRQAR